MNIDNSTFEFLNNLKANNNRDWFEMNKKIYQQEEKKLKQFFTELQNGLNQFDVIEKMKIFRIYKDVRFSKDKTPYKTNRGANWMRAGAHHRGSYYLQLEPGNSFVAGGFFQPNPEDLLRIRKEFEMDATEIRAIFSNLQFQKTYGGFAVYDQLKTAPKGFDKDHPNIDLIRNKNFFVSHKYTDDEVLSKGFSEKVLQHFQLLLPFFNYMSEVLTTDLNGVSLLSSGDD